MLSRHNQRRHRPEALRIFSTMGSTYEEEWSMAAVAHFGNTCERLSFRFPGWSRNPGRNLARLRNRLDTISVCRRKSSYQIASSTEMKPYPTIAITGRGSIITQSPNKNHGFGRGPLLTLSTRTEVPIRGEAKMLNLFRLRLFAGEKKKITRKRTD